MENPIKMIVIFYSLNYEISNKNAGNLPLCRDSEIAPTEKITNMSRFGDRSYRR